MTRNELFEYAEQSYGTLPEYLWESTPDAAVLRNLSNRKWYGIVMRVNEKNLGLDGRREIDILNVKCDPITAGSLRLQKGFLPAYHMNKEKWISIILSEVPDVMIFDLLDQSYDLIAKK